MREGVRTEKVAELIMNPRRGNAVMTQNGDTPGGPQQDEKRSSNNWLFQPQKFQGLSESTIDECFITHDLALSGTFGAMHLQRYSKSQAITVKMGQLANPCGDDPKR